MKTAYEMEKRIEQYLVKRAKEKGWIPFKFVSPAHRGVPDRLIIMPEGKVMFVEVKRSDGRLSELQKDIIQKLRDLDHFVAIVYSTEDVDCLVDELC